jgi:DNA-binding IclR family transcriptional regulator
MSHILRYDSRVSEHRVSDVGVLDKAVVLLDALVGGPKPLARIAEATGIHRATAHRLLHALEAHGLTRQDPDVGWLLGPRLVELGTRAAATLPFAALARPALEHLRETTGESVQLYVREGDVRVCVAAIDAARELRTIVAVGARLPLAKGSAGAVLRSDPRASKGWAESIGEREAGVASVSAPVRDSAGEVRAAVSVSGPIERTTRTPGRRYRAAVVEAAHAIERAAGWRP